MLRACMRHALAAHRHCLQSLITAARKPLLCLRTPAISAPVIISARAMCHKRHCGTLHLQQPLFSWHSARRQQPQDISVQSLHADTSLASPWDSTWDELMDVLCAKGYATEAGSDDWGANKRALLAFARSDNLLSTISLNSIRALVETDIQYMDRKVRNARQRLSLLGGDTPTDVGTGEASFQDVVRLLMAIQLAGNSRTPDNEAAGTPVLRQALQCLRLQPRAAAAPAETSPEALKPPVSAPRQLSGRPKKRQAASWEAAPWSKHGQ